MAKDDIYIATLLSGGTGALMVQDFGYICATEAVQSASNLLAIEFGSDVVDFMAAAVSNATAFLSVQVRNLFDLSDFHVVNYTQPYLGSRTGQPLPSFVTIPFESEKPEVGQRPARKRVGYVSEGDVSGSAIQDTGGTYFSTLNSLAAQLGASLTDTDGNVYDPVIVKRIKYVAPSGKDAYRYPENPSEAASFPAINWLWGPNVTSQISRKLGRGI